MEAENENYRVITRVCYDTTITGAHSVPNTFLEVANMSRRGEAIGSGAGVIAGAAAGAKVGGGIGIAVGGPVGAIVGTIPCAIVGGIIGLLGGNKIGSEVDRYKGR